MFAIGHLTLESIVLFVVGLVILWLLVSIPVYFVGKFVTARTSTLSDAMIATIFGPITYAGTLFLINLANQYARATMLVTIDHEIALVIAFIVWIGVFKRAFATNWSQTFVIALFSILVFGAVGTLFGAVTSLNLQTPFFPEI